ncbi:hypothetical protein IWW38_004655, partial [Coemansia aciculifera]
MFAIVNNVASTLKKAGRAVRPRLLHKRASLSSSSAPAAHPTATVKTMAEQPPGTDTAAVESVADSSPSIAEAVVEKANTISEPVAEKALDIDWAAKAEQEAEKEAAEHV